MCVSERVVHTCVLVCLSVCTQLPGDCACLAGRPLNLGARLLCSAGSQPLPCLRPPQMEGCGYFVRMLCLLNEFRDLNWVLMMVARMLLTTEPSVALRPGFLPQPSGRGEGPAKRAADTWPCHLWATTLLLFCCVPPPRARMHTPTPTH